MATILGGGIQVAIAALQALNATVPSISLNGVMYQVQRFPTNYPPGLETAFLPCTIVFPEAGESATYADTKQTIRNFRMSTYVDPLNQGKYDDPIQAAFMLLQAYLEVYLDKISSTQDRTILDFGATSEYLVQLLPYQSNPILDSGVVTNLKYTTEEDNYVGFDITVKVLIEWVKNC